MIHDASRLRLAVPCTWFPKLSETFILDAVRLLTAHSSIECSVLPVRTLREDALCPVFMSTGLQAVRHRLIADTEAVPPLLDYVRALIAASPGESPELCARVLHGWRWAFEHNEYDIVHAHFLCPAGAMIAALRSEHRLRCPAILEMHGIDIYRIGPSAPESMATVLKAFDCIICNCTHMARQVASVLGSAQNVMVMNHGIDLSKIRVRKTNYVLSTPPHVLFVGRLVEKKGCDILLRALQRLRSPAAPVQATIVGNGPLEEALKQQASDLGLQERVRFAGAIPNHMVLEMMPTVDAVVLPCLRASSGDLDTVPNVLQEAQAIGVPVVSTTVAGIPEIVRHGESGLLVDPGDEAAIRGALEHVLSMSAEAREAMGTRGREWAVFALDMSRTMHERLVPLYRRLGETSVR